MTKRELGQSGIAVTELGFGAWGIGGVHYGEVDRRQAIETTEAYLDSGGNFIDTARGYADSESVIGEVLAGRDRESVVLATKSFKSASLDTMHETRDQLEESLRLLKTEYVDVFYLHSPPDDPDVMQAALDEYEKFRSEGKIRLIGASIKGPSVTPATQALARQYIATGQVNVLQMIYSVLRQGSGTLFHEAKAAGVGIVARTVLESGMLTGKYAPGHAFPDGDQRTQWLPEERDAVLEAVGELKDMGLPAGFSDLAQVATKFALAHEGVSSVILGAVSPDQMKRNMAMADTPALPADVVKRLTEVFADRCEQFNPSGKVRPKAAAGA